MRIASGVFAILLLGCGGNGAAPPPPDSGNVADFAGAPPGADLDVSAVPDLEAARDMESAPDLLPKCSKRMTVVFSVATGSGAAEQLSNGCWNVINADGAGGGDFRKCSTNTCSNPNFNGCTVQYTNKPNYAFDDTNPTQASEDQTFLDTCASGATGIGFEYMAYRGGWLLLPKPNIKGYFAELYQNDQTVWDSTYNQWHSPYNGHTIAPMINIGPQDPSAISAGTAMMCKYVGNGEYFGIYNGDWATPMDASDPRAKALASALNNCTK
jgi:hypothetical protein